MKEITNNYEHDWVTDKFRDNGITNPDLAFWALYGLRFEYCSPDCSFCGRVDNHWKINNEIWKCKSCRKKFSLTSGTYIENNKLEHYHWWRFCYLIAELKIKNSCAIANDLGITQKTAWKMINLLRMARKETAVIKFKNGQEILAFKHLYEPLEILISLKVKPEINFNP
jgi:transposase-like protein